jgi:hypothetical protein
MQVVYSSVLAQVAETARAECVEVLAAIVRSAILMHMSAPLLERSGLQCTVVAGASWVGYCGCALHGTVHNLVLVAFGTLPAYCYRRDIDVSAPARDPLPITDL